VKPIRRAETTDPKAEPMPGPGEFRVEVSDAKGDAKVKVNQAVTESQEFGAMLNIARLVMDACKNPLVIDHALKNAKHVACCPDGKWKINEHLMEHFCQVMLADYLKHRLGEPLASLIEMRQEQGGVQIELVDGGPDLSRALDQALAYLKNATKGN
jgi:hypothetical protein